MALASEKITEQEQIAIVALLYGFIDTWPEAYRIAAGQSHKDAEKDPHFTGYASRWKNSAKVKRYYEIARDKKAVQENDLIREWCKLNKIDPERIQGESEGTKKAREARNVDYTDPANQRRKLNELVNDATDPGEALDALKVIIAGQRDDRQAAKEGKQVRAYLPVICSQCPLYQAQAEKIRRKEAAKG